MPVNPADGPILGTLYGSDAMRAVFDEAAYFQRMLDVEAALATRAGAAWHHPGRRGGRRSRKRRDTTTSTPPNWPPALAMSATRWSAWSPGCRAPPGEAGGWTHWGATTQDIMDTATVLQVRDGLTLIRAELLAIAHALAAQAERHRDTVMAGRTHLQQALPTSFGLKCATWALPFVGHVQRLDQLRPRVEQVEFGGAAGHAGLARRPGHRGHGGAGGRTRPRRARRALARLPRRAGRDRGVSGHRLRQPGQARHRHHSAGQTEVGEVAEPYVAGRGASSTMPQKRNPIASRIHPRRRARGVQALVPLMLGAMAQDHERATGPWQAEALAIPQAFVLDPRRAAARARDRRGHGGRCRPHAAQPGPDARADRGRGGDDGPRAASRPRRGAPRGEARLRRGAGGAHSPGRRAGARDAAVGAKLDRAAIERLTDPAGYLGSSDAFVIRACQKIRAIS